MSLSKSTPNDLSGVRRLVQSCGNPERVCRGQRTSLDGQVGEYLDIVDGITLPPGRRLRNAMAAAVPGPRSPEATAGA